MIKIVLIAVLLVSIVLESTIISFPLSAIALILLNASFKDGKIIWAFFAGLVLDLFSGRILGSSSLFFLLVGWISYRYRKKIHPMNFYYQFFFLILVLSLYSFIFYRYLNFWGLILGAVFGALILRIIKKSYPFIGEKKRLLVE